MLQHTSFAADRAGLGHEPGTKSNCLTLYAMLWVQSHKHNKVIINYIENSHEHYVLCILGIYFYTII